MFFRSKKKQETKIESTPARLSARQPGAVPSSTTNQASTRANGKQYNGKTTNAKIRRARAPVAFEFDKTLGMITRLLSLSEEYKNYRLSDLSWLLYPALQHRQFIIGQGKGGSAGLILWAYVSDEVDARLCKSPNEPIRLQSNEWQSGQNYWIVAAIGADAIMEAMIKQLSKGPFKGRSISVRRRNDDGSYRIVSVDLNEVTK